MKIFLCVLPQISQCTLVCRLISSLLSFSSLAPGFLMHQNIEDPLLEWSTRIMTGESSCYPSPGWCSTIGKNLPLLVLPLWNCKGLYLWDHEGPLPDLRGGDAIDWVILNTTAMWKRSIGRCKICTNLSTRNLSWIQMDILWLTLVRVGTFCLLYTSPSPRD